jgi:tetratricopeptide (TPR) repeat protein
MKRKVSMRYVFLATAVLIATTASALAQGKGSDGQGINLPPEERTLAAKIMSAPDPAAKIKAAGELIKKFPKTSARTVIAAALSDDVAGVKDKSQKLALAQQLQTLFNQPADAEVIGPVVVQAYSEANQADDAFGKGAELLAQAPDALRLLVELVAIATDQVKKQNPKFLTQGIQYGNHAILLIESDKKPAIFDDARWKSFKTDNLPGLYQSLALFHLSKGEKEEAMIRYKKASELAPNDAFNFIMLASLMNDGYQGEAKRYQAMPAGTAKDDQLKKVQIQLDSIIDTYAHAIGLSEGNATYQQVHQQYLQDLESYYKYRHNGSTDGMLELINKYKPATKP